VDFLLPGYGDRDARVRAAVIAAMGNFRGPRVTSTLRYAFDSDSSYAVNAAALRSLAKADSVNALVYAYRGLERNSHKEVVRLAALNLLARLSDEDEVLETIRSYAEPGRPAELRVLAISLLVSKWNDDDDAMDFVVTLISDPSYQVRRAAVQHLGASGYRDALSPLTRRLVKEPDTRIQAAIRESIKNIETKKR
jgi:pyruvate-formate lyase-activating enzyme